MGGNFAEQREHDALARSLRLVSSDAGCERVSEIDATLATVGVLETDAWPSIAVYDALGRASMLQSSTGTPQWRGYTDDGLLERVERDDGDARETVYEVDAFDHLGRPVMVQHGGAATTRLSYDDASERLIACASAAANGKPLQGLSYTHDAVGNIVRIADASRPAVYAGNAKHEAVNDYRYDALYRLVEASGREHVGQIDGKTPRASAPVVAAEPNDAGALRRYVQRYRYDAAGNLLRLEHDAGAGSYTRVYAYGERGNRLRATGRREDELVERYRHDVGGHMLAMPHLDDLRWNELGELDRVRVGTMTAYFQYAGGVRVRKYVVKGGAVFEDRRIVDGVEVYTKGRKREYLAPLVDEATTTEVLAEAGLRIDRKTKREGVACDVVHWRYALHDHLGSVAVEVDRAGRVISREEYHPWGTTAVRAVTGELGVSPRRHRYLARERDDETGLALHGARYYAPWLGRWTAADPIGLAGGFNRYAYCRGSPVTFSDVDGCDAVSATDPAVLTAMLQAEATRQAAVKHVWRSQMRHALDGVDAVDAAIAAASASEALYGPELPEASWSGAVENFLADAAVTSAQIALAPLMWEPDAPAVRWAGELEAYKNPHKVREEDRAMQAASEWVVIGAAIVFEPGAAAGATSLARGGLGQIRRLRGAALRRMRSEADDALRPAVRLAPKVDLSAGGEFIDDGVRRVDQPLAGTAAEPARRSLPARQVEAVWGRSSYRHGGLMTGMEHILYRHSARSGFANVSRYSYGTTARDVVGYVDDALRHGTVTPNGAGAYIVEHDLGRVIGTNIPGDAAMSICVFIRDGVIQTAFPF